MATPDFKEEARAKAAAREEARAERLKVHWRVKQHNEEMDRLAREQRAREHHEKRIKEMEADDERRAIEIGKQRAYVEEHRNLVRSSLGEPLQTHKYGESIEDTISRLSSRSGSRGSSRTSSSERGSTATEGTTRHPPHRPAERRPPEHPHARRHTTT